MVACFWSHGRNLLRLHWVHTIPMPCFFVRVPGYELCDPSCNVLSADHAEVELCLGCADGLSE